MAEAELQKLADSLRRSLLRRFPELAAEMRRQRRGMRSPSRIMLSGGNLRDED
ncbi:hypothetical protein AB0I94_02280 [Streptomyces sp. NPDC050147]|uniref:hypothetical protein n=1 Tax=Streptomyces sp. NPDC050147 TaxID=3155513 RepID=UPI00344191D9